MSHKTKRNLFSVFGYCASLFSLFIGTRKHNMLYRRLRKNNYVYFQNFFTSNKNGNKLLSTTCLPQFTKDRYQNLKRGSFSSLNNTHIGCFKHLLGESRVLTNMEECEPYNIDWIKAARGNSQCVLKPKTTDEVSKILKFCNENTLAVCPQGGNTGLVAGSVPVFDEIILSTSLMNKILHVNDISGTLVCQAGCILENLELYLNNYGLIMPLDLGAKGSCQIGGNVATNAGGLRLLRYGNLQGNVLGIEAVKANGEIIDNLSTLKKDNTGYHLKNLFIGSEGSLGVITKVAIQCFPKPVAVNLAFLGLDSMEQVLKTLKRAKKEVGEILSACELIDSDTLDVVTGNLNLKSPLPQYPFYMLIETHGTNNKHDEDKLMTFLQRAMHDNIVLDGTVTNEPGKMKLIWNLRERLTEGLILDGYVFKYDISLPIQHFYSLIPEIKKLVGPQAVRVSGYGHLGDGNVHLNVSVKEFSTDVLKLIEPFVYEYTSKLNGSISAEHGIGFRKVNYLHYSKSDGAITLMKNLKELMDPKGILNPYKVIPNN